MILSQIKIYPVQRYAASVIDELESVQVLLASESDCLQASVSIESGETEAILYLEKWRSRESLEQHLRSSTYMRVLEALELFSQIPEVSFFDGREIGGLQLIEMARSLSAKEV